MKVIDFITEYEVINRIIQHLPDFMRGGRGVGPQPTKLRGI